MSGTERRRRKPIRKGRTAQHNMGRGRNLSNRFFGFISFLPFAGVPSIVFRETVGTALPSPGLTRRRPCSMMRTPLRGLPYTSATVMLRSRCAILGRVVKTKTGKPQGRTPPRGEREGQIWTASQKDERERERHTDRKTEVAGRERKRARERRRPCVFWCKLKK